MHSDNAIVNALTPARVITDAEWAAQVAADALMHGRIRLGAAFARIALQALNAETSKQGDGLDEPVPFLPVYAGVAQVAPDDLSAADLAEAQDKIQNARADPPATARCAAEFRRDGVKDICGTVVYWVEGSRLWLHLDPALDVDHPPLITMPPPEPGP